MLELSQIPAFKEKDLKWGECTLSIAALPAVTALDAAWQMLPAQGQGVVVCADVIRRHAADKSKGLLLDAEVVSGRETVVVRSSGNRWLGWRWSESDGTSHRYVEHTLLSSEPGKNPPHLVYRQYWEKCDDEGLAVWQPIGSRFCGFQEA